MAFYRMSGSSKGELHGASILVTVDGGTSGETVTLTLGSTYSKSGVLSDDGTCLFTDLLEAGTYVATYQTFTASVEVSASDILNKVTKSVTIAMSTTITLTLEGAREDNITITDKDGNQVGICVFPTDSVTGTVDIEIPPEGGVYTFTSSVAKDTTTGTNNYSKNVTLTNSSSDIKIMPEGALYWYGNECFDSTYGLERVDYITPPVSTFQKNTNSYSMKSSGVANSDIASLTRLKIESLKYKKLFCEVLQFIPSSAYDYEFDIGIKYNGGSTNKQTSMRTTTPTIIEVNINGLNNIDSIVNFITWNRLGVTISRFWLE